MRLLWRAYVFAPLRGWYALSVLTTSPALVFAPLRGSYTIRLGTPTWHKVIAPLRGLYPKYITKHRKTEEPDG